MRPSQYGDSVYTRSGGGRERRAKTKCIYIYNNYSGRAISNYLFVFFPNPPPISVVVVVVHNLPPPLQIPPPTTHH